MFRLTPDERPITDIDAVALRRQAKSGAAPDSERFDLREAIAKHLLWKTNLRNAALHNDPLDVAAIACDNCCALGQWLYGSAQAQWGGQPRFTELLERHREFHMEAGHVAQVIEDGDAAAGLRMMQADTRFAQATQAVVMVLRKWGTSPPSINR
jgi:hypothetical protein